MEISAEEAIALGAVDSEFYSTYFFPKAFRQECAPIHKRVWKEFEGGHRYLGLKIFRDGAKTTLTRACISKRVAYGLSRTILVVGKSEDAASKTLEWIKRAVQFNTRWTQTFGLKQGLIWNNSHIIIESEPLGISIQILAIGITGSIRGINLDDYRPDFIIVDDPCDEENTGTPEQRQKISELFFGGLKNTLAPATDMPEAMMVLLQTPLHPDDLISRVELDPEWHCVSFSILDERGQSTWPARHPTETVLAEKAAYIQRNQLSIWLREKEVTAVSPEASYFRSEWLRYWDVLPEGGVVYIGIDPTPPPKDSAAIAKRKDLDDCVVLAIKYYKGAVYVLDYFLTKSPQEEEIFNSFFDMRRRFRPHKLGIETHLFQRTLKAGLEREMKARRELTQVVAVEDKRPKPVRISGAINEYASHGRLYVHANHTELISQFCAYPQCAHDDILDALAIAISLVNPHLDNVYEGEFEVVDDPETQKLLANWRR